MAADPLTFTFADDGTFPNSRLPLLLYRSAIAPEETNPEAMERLFAGNDWPPQWRSGIYPFHHYHSTSHEVLGIARGSARLMLGGPEGRELSVSAGDVVVIPAGVAHRRLASSADFLVVGAYPPGQAGDIVREEASPAMKQRIALLSYPPKDPVLGDEGPMLRLWANTSIT